MSQKQHTINRFKVEKEFSFVWVFGVLKQPTQKCICVPDLTTRASINNIRTRAHTHSHHCRLPPQRLLPAAEMTSGDARTRGTPHAQQLGVTTGEVVVIERSRKAREGERGVRGATGEGLGERGVTEVTGKEGLVLLLLLAWVPRKALRSGDLRVFPRFFVAGGGPCVSVWVV